MEFFDLWSPAVSTETRSLLRIWRNRDDVRSQMVNDKEISEEEHRQWLDRLRNKEVFSDVRVAHVNGIPMGIIALSSIDIHAGSASWSMYIGESAFRGQGYSGAMVDEVIRWGFDELRLRRLYTSVLSTNERAFVQYLRRGFRLEGCWREHLIRSDSGKTVDLYWLGMLRSEWCRTKACTRSQ
ncbi:MAG: UDP-4-amino-4,6-dideoxy-N-acetyl-beta-L-altrosamine N-acetyltransferase [Dethiosulfovibrio peptidovorans]|nr:MAG: UDP-4-amino-4,6-dideoxy-N-acetyl-beta-L-altrosamine N-acetyltransferase [Dethiosulfovibrio peptidovorans]